MYNIVHLTFHLMDHQVPASPPVERIDQSPMKNLSQTSDTKLQLLDSRRDVHDVDFERNYECVPLAYSDYSECQFPLYLLVLKL